MKNSSFYRKFVTVILCIFVLIAMAGEMIIGEYTDSLEGRSWLESEMLNHANMIIYKGEQKRQTTYIDWNLEYPKPETSHVSAQNENTLLERYEGYVNNIKNAIDGMTTRKSPCYRWANSAVCQFEKILYFDRTYYEFDVATNEQIAYETNEIIELNNFCHERGIDFIYCNPGTENGSAVHRLDTINYNTNRFLQILENADVFVFDVREEFRKDGLDAREMWFYTDSHWKSTTGFYVAQKIVEQLNEEYGYNFEMSQLSADVYETTIWEPRYGKELYEYYVPIQDQEFNLIIPEVQIDVRGDFYEVFVNVDQRYELFDITECYWTWSRVNDDISYTYNRSTSNNNRVLLIADSFSWSVTPYLSQCIYEVDTLYLGGFNASIEKYIEETEPDAVIFMCTPKRIGNDNAYNIQ